MHRLGRFLFRSLALKPKLNPSLVCSCLVLGVAAGCSSGPKRLAPDALAPSRLEISLRKTDYDRWEAIYRTDRPVEVLHFEQQAHRFRSGNWRPADSAFRVAELDGKEAIFRDGYGGFTEVVLDLGPTAPAMTEAFNFSIPFTDGSRALYTGHFLIHGGLDTVFEFIPAPGESVVVDGEVSAAPMRWKSPSDLTEYGAYAYFGKIAVRSHGLFDALLDPGLPRKLRETIDYALPQALAKLQKSTHVTPAKRVLLLVGLWPRPLDRHRFVGAAGERWIAVDLQGEQWRTETPEAVEKFFIVLAHELSHLWTGQAGVDQKRYAWLNEGGADFLAGRLALEAGLFKPHRYRERLRTAADACAEYFAKKHRKDSDPTESGDGGFFYRCGSTVHAAIDRALRRTGRKDGFYGFWGELMLEARGKGLKFGAPEYFAAARKAGAGPVVADLERLVSGKAADPKAIVRRIRDSF